MTGYVFPQQVPPPQAGADTVYTVASGDLRRTANVVCWPTQLRLEDDLTVALNALGRTVRRGHHLDPDTGHGFIDSQRAGMDVFRSIPADAPLVVAEAVWQYSHHVLPGLRSHRGPILIVANFSGEYPGLVGLLGLSASLVKAGVAHSTLWSTDFTDEWSRRRLQEWIDTGRIEHDLSHVRDLPALSDTQEVRLGRALAAELQREKAIIGVLDEGCMGMYNAIIDDELLNPLGIYKERLSQSALVVEMRKVSDSEAQAVRHWLDEAGMTFHTGTDEASELTDAQLLSQFRMYIAAVRMADDYGLDAIGIQYQQGLKDVVPASDLAEGLLNNVSRPPVFSRDGDRELFAGLALPHFNEVDEGAAVDSLLTNRIWTAMGFDPATTLHDIRWGQDYDGQFVWVFEISGAAPASHHGGYAKSWSMRQPAMYFPLGGGTLAGVAVPGEIIWSRVFIENASLHVDLGRGTVIELPEQETRRRLSATTSVWPIMHLVTHGVSRDQLMARHRANHANVAYAPNAGAADRALEVKATMFAELGVTVHLCGTLSL